jgi:hypothetical protein
MPAKTSIALSKKLPSDLGDAHIGMSLILSLLDVDPSVSGSLWLAPKPRGIQALPPMRARSPEPDGR